jgi:hypothetical protein
MDEDIIKVKPVGGYWLQIWFKDSTIGDLDFNEFIKFRGVFKPLKDIINFKKVYVNSELGCIEWPNGADFDSLVLYSKVTGRSIESFLKVDAIAEKV